MAGYTGQCVRPRTAVQVQADLRGPKLQCLVGREREGRAAELHRVDAEQQMMHDRVTDQRHLENVVGVRLRLTRDVGREPIQRLAHRGGHLLRPARVHHGIGDAAHQILAEADLRVHDAARGEHLAGLEIAEVGGDGGGADVHGEPERQLVKARPDADDPLAAVHGDRHFPVSLAQRRLQPLQHVQVAAEAGQLPLALQGLLETLQIARGIVHVGLAHLDVVQARHRIQRDGSRLGLLADDLPVHLAGRRHVHDQVALDARLTGEAVAGRQRPAAGGIFLGRAGCRQVFRPGDDAVLGELALHDQHFTASADGAAAAYRVDVHSQRACGLQEWGAEREASALSGRREDDQRVRLS